MLTFAPEAGKEAHYYAPVLTQMHLLGTAHSKRRIPKHVPLPGEPLAQALRSNASAQCEIPPVSLDDKRDYMEFDWSIYLSAHHVARASLAESARRRSTVPDLHRSRRARRATRRSWPTSSLTWAWPPRWTVSTYDLCFCAWSSLKLTLKFNRVHDGRSIHASDRPGRLVASSLATLVWNEFADPIRKSLPSTLTLSTWS